MRSIRLLELYLMNVFPLSTEAMGHVVFID